MNILVIGGQGFIGNNLVLKLLKEGHNITIFNRNIKEDRYLDSCKYIAGEFADINKFRYMLKNIDVVYHLISTTIPQISNFNPSYDIESNVITSVKLLEMCCEENIKKIIFSSSGGTVYGIPKTVPIKEDDPNEPISSYGISKLMIEKYLHLFKYLYGLNYTVLRIANPYGPYQNPLSNQGAIGIFLWKLLKGEEIEIWGNGSVCRDYIFIEDVIDAMYLFALKDTRSNIFNIGSGIGITLNELILIMKDVLKVDVKVIYKESRKVDVPTNVLDIKRIREELEWKPKVDIYSGIRKTWNWAINNYK